MFSAIPLTPIFLNPDDLQDSEHGASVDINTFDGITLDYNDIGDDCYCD
jgi:hypothetical protein